MTPNEAQMAIFQTALDDIVGKLGAAVAQYAPSDDQIIANTVRAAHTRAVGLRRDLIAIKGGRPAALLRTLTEDEAEVIQHAMDWCEYQTAFENLGQPTQLLAKASLEKLDKACADLAAECEGQWRAP